MDEEGEDQLGDQDPYGQEDYEGEKVMDDPYYNEYAVDYQE